MPRIQHPEITRRLGEKFSLKGVVDVSTLAPEIVPIVDVDKLLEKGTGVEDVRYAAAVVTRNAVAGEYGRAVLLNPSDSGVVIDDIEFSITSSDSPTMRIVRHDGAMATPASSRYYHSAIDPLLSTAGQVSHETDPAASLTQLIDYLRISANENLLRSYPGLVLLPGFGFGIQCDSQNMMFNWCVRWRERQLEDWERALVS
jgi:hypothetical protein